MWVEKVICRIGMEADILVKGTAKDALAHRAWLEQKRTDPKCGHYLGNRVKCASALGLRRSLGDRLRNAGVSPLIITRILRHSSWKVTSRFYAPGNIRSEALEIKVAIRPPRTICSETSNKFVFKS